MLFLSSVTIALIADIASWISEGHPEFVYITIAANTVAACAGKFAIICFLGYLKENLYESSRAAAFTVKLFSALGALSILFSIGNAFWGYAFYVNDVPHWPQMTPAPSFVIGVFCSRTEKKGNKKV